MIRPTLKERISLLPDLAHQFVLRAAAEGSKSSYIDFSVLSVAVTTLGLILLVQLVRHRLDRNASGRPFVKTVLEGVYRELATLGIVELVIFLLHKYYRDLNVAQELLFADVHFTLFFTALFNAFQSCIMAFFISRNSDKLWVQTEYQDLHHYVEIREEFDRLDKELSRFKRPDSQWEGSTFKSSQNSKRPSLLRSEFQHSMQSIKRLWLYLLQSARYPRLSRRHNQLLIQVRFHELKFHFIQANKLPMTLQISDYMKRCELRILKKLVHIKTLAWLLLTALFNLLYFLMGVVVFTTNGSLEAVGRSLTMIFFGSMFFSVALSLIIWNKMSWIFDTIMHSKLITQTGPAEQHENGSESNSGASVVFDQQSLFWGSNPRVIILMIQLMQFGFALALSILLVFWDDIHPNAGSPGLEAFYFLLVILVCYACFVMIISHVVPRFTLCSSIGQMVNRDQLHETLARHRLNEAQRERQQKLMEEELEKTFRNEESSNFLRWVGNVYGMNVLSNQQKAHVVNAKEKTDPSLWLELVNANTEDLRKTLPEEMKGEFNETERNQGRRYRRKTLSDGVDAMREMVGLKSDSGSFSDSRKPKRHTRQKSLSASASIQMMRDVTTLSTPAKQKEVEAPPTTKDDLEVSMANRDKRRARRKKTVSASADIRMMRMGSCRENSESSLICSSKTEAAAAETDCDPRRVSFSDSAPMQLLQSPDQGHRTFQVNGLQTLHRLAQSDYHLSSNSQSNHINQIPEASSVAQMEKMFSSWIHEDKPPSQEVPAVQNSKLCDENEKVSSTAEEAGTEADSYDDDHSDVDDLPEVQENDKLWKMEPPPPKRTFLDVTRSYFRGRFYVIVSTLLGTMTCFFVVGMRLEAVLIETGVLVDYKNTWHLQAEVSFWVEFSMLTSFILGDFIIIYLFRPSRMLDSCDCRVFMAGVVDLCICTTCYCCLIASQALRCCDKSEKRFLGEQSKGDYNYGSTEVIPCCPPFGERLYGGFGDIEMFTSLVALRVLRFSASRMLSHVFGHRFGPMAIDSVVSQGDDSQGQNPFDTFHDVSVRTRSKRNLILEDQSGTIVELWKSALTLFPEIVAEHGEFSSELLQAMLGISIVGDDRKPAIDGGNESSERVNDADKEAQFSGDGVLPSQRSIDEVMRTRLGSGDFVRSHVASGDQVGSGDMDQQRILKPVSLTADRRYSSLSAASQAVILAGKLGKSVRAIHHEDRCSTIDDQSRAHPYSSFGEIAEPHLKAESGAHLQARPALLRYWESRNDLGPGIPAPHMLEFEISADADDESASQFVSPNARLIRSMRRCDRKVIPMLLRWASVDVVITNFEIVYFDANDTDDLDGVINPRVKRMQDIRQAIIATKGGKGLRLRDVAFGRRVVGTHVLNDIEEIRVDRRLPLTVKDDNCDSVGREPQLDEFWKEIVQRSDVKEDSVTLTERHSRHNRWSNIKEDHLRIMTKHDTLHLRFYSDLENCEAHVDRMLNENEAEGELYKNNAFQWCQTIGRLVGASKLKQELPHFGEDNSDELRDYLVVFDPNKEPSTMPVVDRFKKIVGSHRRQRSDALGTSPALSAGSPHHRRHQSEMGMIPLEINDETFGHELKPLPKPKPARRTISLHAPSATVESDMQSAKKKRPGRVGHFRRASSVGETTNYPMDVGLISRTIMEVGSAEQDLPDAPVTSNGDTLT